MQLQHDACQFECRDEFSLDFRTNQYREQLKMEDKYAKKALELLRSNHEEGGHDGAAETTFGLTEGIDKPFLYDLVFEKEDSAHSGSSKLSRCAARLLPCGVSGQAPWLQG